MPRTYPPVCANCRRYEPRCECPVQILISQEQYAEWDANNPIPIEATP